MSEYGDYGEPRRYRTTRTRPRDRGEPEFVQETTYVERGKGPPPRDLVYRPREESVEDIPRDFPPPGGDRYARRRDNHPPPRRARSVGRRDYYEDDDRYSDYAVPAAAGAAGYAAARGNKGRRDRRERHDRDYDSEDYQSPRRHRDRKKSGVGEVLEGLGLGGVAAAITGRSRSRSRSRHRRDKSRGRGYSSGSSRSRTRSRSKGRSERKWAQAAQAALVAGAVEAFRSRKEAGPWTGEKGRRIATAALSAGGIDGLVDRDPEKKTKRHLAEAVIGGLAANRLANGPRSKSRGGRDDSPYGRSRSRSRSVFGRGRSQSRGRDGGGGGGGAGLGGLAAGGAIAAAGKAIYDRVRSKSRRRRSPSSSSADSYVPSRNRRRTNGQARSLPPDTGARGDRGRTPKNGALPAAAAGAGAGALATRNSGANRGRGESSSSSSTTDMEQKRKKMRGKELITAGLATVATIHAAHGVYSSMEAHEKRHKLVAEGEMSPQEARKIQTKAWVQDAAAVGIAALGIKGAFSEWKEMNEHRYELNRPVTLNALLIDCTIGVRSTRSRRENTTGLSVA